MNAELTGKAVGTQVEATERLVAQYSNVSGTEGELAIVRECSALANQTPRSVPTAGGQVQPQSQLGRSPADRPTQHKTDGFCPVNDLALLYCEDFEKTQDGALPEGWRGGAGLGVIVSEKLRGSRVLASFETRLGGFSAEVPWHISGDYRVDWVLLPGKGHLAADWNCGFTVKLAGVTATATQAQFSLDTFVKLANSVARIDWNGFYDRYHSMALERRGSTLRLFWEGQQVLVSRVETASDPESILLVEPCSGGFALDGIRVKRLD